MTKDIKSKFVVINVLNASIGNKYPTKILELKLWFGKNNIPDNKARKIDLEAIFEFNFFVKKP